jgi:hypothetical protein
MDLCLESHSDPIHKWVSKVLGQSQGGSSMVARVPAGTKAATSSKKDHNCGLNFFYVLQC